MIKKQPDINISKKQIKLKIKKNHFLLDINLIYYYSACSRVNLAQFLYLKKLETISACYRRISIREEIKAARVWTFRWGVLGDQRVNN